MAHKFSFKKIDAFATGSSSGNPAGMVYLEPDEHISEGQMQRIAAELKGFVNEVAYVRQLDEDSFSLRYYSSEREVEFCGHATIAAFNELLRNRDDLVNKAKLRLHINYGEISLWNKLKEEDAIYISAPLPEYRQRDIDPASLASALGRQVDSLADNPPLKIVNAGLETLLAPMASLQDALDLNPDYDTLKKYSEDIGVDVVTIYSPQVANEANRYRTRVFATTFGYLEDPATGAGNAALGYYLLKLGLWEGEAISIEQNRLRDQPNIVKLGTDNSAPGKRQVIVGGGAITRIRGTYHLV